MQLIQCGTEEWKTASVPEIFGKNLLLLLLLLCFTLLEKKSCTEFQKFKSVEISGCGMACFPQTLICGYEVQNASRYTRVIIDQWNGRVQLVICNDTVKLGPLNFYEGLLRSDLQTPPNKLLNYFSFMVCFLTQHAHYFIGFF